ncbi:MAG: DNA polymerase III subunit beta [Gammaproteobacteria bacterium]|nr:MAG: DNA polymerase III subunit beta [Gammaproteobacteria bacterium]
MKFSVNRDELLRPLQQVSGVVERKQTQPILSNVLIVADADQLSLTGTDLEIELVAKIGLTGEVLPGEITVPARKLLDICKSLPAGSEITISKVDQKLVVKAGKSRFSLITLPAVDFPNLEETVGLLEFTIDPQNFIGIVGQTAFSMAQQDIRHYLNGMLLEVSQGHIRSVATDGHRLALADVSIDFAGEDTEQIILPRKGVLELSRVLSDYVDPVRVSIGSNHLRVATASFTFTSKLVDGKYPDYMRVLPKRSDRKIFANREELRQALQRVAILSNEKYRGIRVLVSNDQIQITANNPEQEEAEEQVSVTYEGEPIEVGFNVSYLLDVLNVIKEEQVVFDIADSNSSAIIYGQDNEGSLYVVMPMRL